MAASTAARPAGRIRPASISRPPHSTFFADHTLFARRGVTRVVKWCSSRRLTCPSIQPKQRSDSTISDCFSVGSGAPFLAITTWIPGERSCSASSHASNAAWSPNR